MTFTNVWGPARTYGINWEWYYVSFTDSTTCQTVIYFMKQKSEVENKIKNYVTYILTQTGKHCKAFHFDNSGEYISTKVKTYLSSQGIRCKIMGPYSPQQNGIAE